MHGPGRQAPPPPDTGGADVAAFLSGGRNYDDAPEDDGPGPWFEAAYGGNCTACEEYHIEPGDTIRADGSGGYEHEDCARD